MFRKWRGPSHLTLFYVVTLLFLFSYGFLNYVSIQEQQFNSPDEMASLYFLNKYSQNEIVENNFVEYNEVHPRSVLVWQNKKVPVAFVGYLFVFVLIYKFFTLWGILLLMFFLAVVLCYLFYKWLKKYQSPQLATLSLILLIFNPAFLYYINKFLYHNILFVLVALIAWLLYWRKHKYFDYLALFCLAVAFWLRPTELIWLIPLLLWTWSYLKWPWMKRILHLSISGVSSFIMFITSNYLIYGHPYLFGYVLPKSKNTLVNINDVQSIFTINLKNLLINAQNFLIVVFWPWAWVLILALIVIIFTWQRQNKFFKWYIKMFGTVSGLLVLYYGSWALDEHIVSGTVSIGNSFVRYWLVIYILAVPIIAYFLLLLWRLGIKFVAVILGGFLLVSSLYFVLWGYDDSLLKVNQNIYNYVEQKHYIKEILPAENTVLVVDRDDKFIFPDYEVIHLSEFKGEAQLQEISQLLLDDVKVYYYGFSLIQTDLEYLHTEIFPNYGYKMEPYYLGGDRAIYQFIKQEYENEK